MKIERLKQKNKKPFIIGTILVVVIGGALTYRLTHSKYRTTQSIDLATGTINYTVPDFRIVEIKTSEDKTNYNDVSSVPTSGYVLNTTKSVCNVDNTKDSNITIEYSNGKVNFKNVTKKGTKCYLYFDKYEPTASEIILSNLGENIKTNIPDFSQVATSDEGVFATADGMYGGTTYYWRGAATTNHVIFANKCWRIVRINGDKTIRLIHNGTPTSGTCADFGSGAVIMGSSNAEKYYATSDGQYNNPSYVGWKYELSSPRPASTTSGTDSNAKVQTQKWYDSNIGNSPKYSAKVAEGKFCNDREIGSGSWTTSTSSSFYYAGYTRLITNKTPTFNCNNANDVYTLEVGAITADEVEFAGGVYGTGNSSYYMYTGQNYWTMSPFRWDGDGYAIVFIVNSNGDLNFYNVNWAVPGLRPVINLKADTTFATGGTGAQNNPYVVSQN